MTARSPGELGLGWGQWLETQQDWLMHLDVGDEQKGARKAVRCWLEHLLRREEAGEEMQLGVFELPSFKKSF